MKGDPWRGVVFCFFWYMSIFCGWLLLCLPCLPLLFLNLRLYRTAIDLVFAVWELYPVALMELLFSTEFVMSGDVVRPWERSILVMNHRTRLDWNFLWGAVHYGTTTPAHRLKFVLKSPIRHFPGPGWVMQMAGFFFIHRKWERDQELLNKMLGYLEELDYTYQVLIFPEGTDLTEKSLNRSHSYADKNGLSRYSQVLHPKTTGFTYLVNRMNSGNHLDAVYDLTVGYPDTLPETEMDVLKGYFPARVHFSIKRYGLEDLPTGEDNVKGWLSSLWKDKEEKLTNFYSIPKPEDRRFEDENVKLNRWPRPLSNIIYLAVIFWTSVVFLCLYLFACSFWFRIYATIACIAFATLSYTGEGMYHAEIAWAKSRGLRIDDDHHPQSMNGGIGNSNGKIKGE